MIVNELSRREQTTVITTVEYTFPDGESVTVDVAHFCPADEAAIQTGIANRYESELRAHEASLLPEL